MDPSIFPTLRHNYNAAVFGASGGIGAALTAQLEADPRCARVFAGTRSSPPDGSGPHQDKRRPFQFDLLDEDSLTRASARICGEGPLDLILVATGFLHGPGIQPEKTWRAMKADAFSHAFAVNAIGPAMIAKHCLAHLNTNDRSMFVAMSARVGSISDNRLGGWHAYRASKAALNMILKTLSVELTMKNRNALCVGIHPGTVATTLSDPFTGRSSGGKLFTPNESAQQITSLLNTLTPEHSGRVFAWDGAEILP